MLATVALLLALGLDTFAVALGLGMKNLPRAQWLRLALTFAAFEGLMPAIGLVVGRGLLRALGHGMSYIAGVILVSLGLWEIRESPDADDASGVQPSGRTAGGRQSWLLGLTVSLDEFAVGLSLSVFRVPVIVVLAYVALQAIAVTFIGLTVGRRVGARFRERSELIAALLFILLGELMIVSTWTGFEFV